MWIVRLALGRPYTFVVMAVLIAILGGTAIVNMPVDIFPYIDIPVVSVLYAYNGLSPDEMEKRVLTPFERSLTSNVNDIEHIESQAYNGYAAVRIYFHPNVNVDMAVAQVTATMNTSLRQMPPGMFPANILKYDAASVPILQLGLTSKTLREHEIFDLGNNFIRTPLGTVQGASVSYPFGGKSRAVMVDLNLDELYAKQLSPIDVSNAINLQNLILPAGTAKLSNTEYQVRVNSSPSVLDELNNLPIRNVNGATVYVKDVAQVRDGFQVQQNIVRTNGNRGVLMTITRNGKASTLSIVNQVKAALPRILANVTPELKVIPLVDQSVFVRASIDSVVKEALLAATLTGLMILLFLGSWRSTLIVCISIPLSILTSLSVLSMLGQTINVMTLGGLSLAVGILVDDATVEIENTHRNLAMRKPLIRAVLDGASQIAVPTFVATLSICIVFVPVLLLTGTARYLFTPLAMAVVFAMMASYLLSRTLVPTMMAYLLGKELHHFAEDGHAAPPSRNPLRRIHAGFNSLFERLRYRYMGLLDFTLAHRAPVLAGFLGFSLLSLGLVELVGQDFFPNVDSGQMRLHARAPAGTRIEETEARFAAIEREIRSVIPADELEMLIDNIGIPNSWPAIAQGDIPTISAADGEILIALNKEKHGPTAEYETRLRKRLNEKFTDMEFFFQPANITSQIINFGLPAPIDLQVVGRNAEANYQVARRLMERISRIPGAVDVHVHQVVAQPELRINVDRTRAAQLGLTQRDVTSSMLISLSGSGTFAPNFWLNPANGVNYSIGGECDHGEYAVGRRGEQCELHGSGSCGRDTGLRQPRGGARHHTNADEYRKRPARFHTGDRESLQRLARVRRVCQRRKLGPGWCRQRSAPDHEGGGIEAAARHHAQPARAGGDDAEFVFPSRSRVDLCGRSGVPADDGQFPVVGRSVHYPDGAARRHGGYSVDAVRNGYHAERSIADGFHHVHRRGHRQQYPDGDVRQRRAGGRAQRTGSDAVRRIRAYPSRFDDGHRNDPRHAADVARPG
jgi:multidrug efflux pump subunit AcrB